MKLLTRLLGLASKPNIQSIIKNMKPFESRIAACHYYTVNPRLAWRSFIVMVLSLVFIGLTENVRAQIAVSDDFNDGNDVGWTPYEGSPGTRETQFPGGAYRLINHSPKDESGIFTRGASIRNDASYQDQFFIGVDVTTWDDNMIGLAGSFLLAKAQTPGSLTTFGYLVGYFAGGPLAPQGLMGFIEFQSELTSTYPDLNTGGAALTTKLDPSKGYRFVFKSAPGDLGGLLIGEMYDRFDLLEPISRGVARDDVTFSVHPNGVSGIGNLHVGEKDTVDWTGTADVTFDNYYSIAKSNNFIGFVGVPQVGELVPGPQTLFYPIPASNPITFAVQTFNSNPINTNSLKMFLNGADVTSQLILTNRSTLLNPNPNFGVRYTGTLAPNTIYNGKIIILDNTGSGTTNTWVFDTFLTNGTVTIEAEDFNYGGGLYQDNPPVSGLKADGTPVGGAGTGYYNGAGATDIVGIEDIDYHDSHVQGIDTAARNQYRTADFIGTVQGRVERVYDVRQKYRTADVGEYVIAGANAGEWMNYTRTFPAGSYNVYLRASSQKAQAMRFDEVTAGSTTSNQTTVLRGQFLVPNTGASSRFRYVPLTDSAGNIQTLNLSGVKTLRLTDLESSQQNTLTVGDLQLNYLLFVPAAAPGTLRPFIAYANPAGGTVLFDPEGTVQIHILNRDTPVSTASIQLRFDGNNVTSGSSIIGTTTNGPGATITYHPTGFLLPGSVHTLNVVFSDGTISQTNQWSFTVLNMPTLLPSDRELTGPDNTFSVQVNKSQNADPTAKTTGSFNNNISRAERQLAGTLGDSDTPGFPFVNEADPSRGFNAVSFVEPTAIHYDQCGGATPFFGTAKPYPGIPLVDTNNATWDCGAGTTPDHFAIAASIKLFLAAGIYRMGFDADDEVAVQAGQAGTNFQGFALKTMLGNSETIPGQRRDDANGIAQFNFAVQTNGVYNFRIIQEEGTGGAFVDWYWVNRTTGARELVRPISLLSSATFNGTYTVESSALINPCSKTITVPKSGNTRFYRLNSTTGYTLGSPVISGNNIVLSYQ